MSPSSRRAWIEIPTLHPHARPAAVALLAEGVDRNVKIRQVSNPATPAVALLAEGVDRNRSIWEATDCLSTSPSSRRAWIEIGKAGRNLSRAAVALLAEGVDRNHTVCLWRCFRGVALLAEGVDRNIATTFAAPDNGKSPSSRRAWIEMFLDGFLPAPPVSPSSRRAWIEIRFPVLPLSESACRPPRGGRG